MRSFRTLTGALVVLALACPASAAAVAPANDNYLASTSINAADGSLPREFTDRVDTTEATTQADLFNPNREGLPGGGGPAEPVTCAGAAGFGKTVWYDFVAPSAGGFEIVASGFDAVVAVYPWNASSSQLGARVACGNESSGASERLLLQPEIVARRPYTIQIGGVNGAGGALDLQFSFYPDRDGDGSLDEGGDDCPDLPGTIAGCPPLVRGGARLSYDNVPGGVRITRLFAERVDKGARVEARCGRCGRSVSRTATRAGILSLTGFLGRVVRAGDRLQVFITQPATRSGRYRFGAIGKVTTWPVRSGGLGALTQRCLRPGTHKSMKCP
jgi:hypothetical protein